MAQRYGCTPGQILKEPVTLLSLVELALLSENDKIKKEEAKIKKAGK